MKKFIGLFLLTIISFSAVHAENVNMLVPAAKSVNYALYPAATGVFLQLDTRDGTIQAIVPSDIRKNRVLNSQPLVSDNTPGRFELYPTDDIWKWLLFDTTTGEMWILEWAAKHNILSKIPVAEIH